MNNRKKGGGRMKKSAKTFQGESVEFSPYEFGTVICLFAAELQRILKDVPKSRRYIAHWRILQFKKGKK